MKTTEERVKNILKKRDDYIMKKKKEGYAIVSCVAVIAAIIVGTSVISPNVDIKKYEKQLAFETMEEKDLLTFNSKQELIKVMKNSDAYKNSQKRNYGIGLKGVSFDATMPETAVTNDAVMTTGVAEESRSENSAFSETNTQVVGVDEADIVKTNGNYIYYLNNNLLRVFDNTGSKLKLKKEIEFNEKQDNNDYYYYNNVYARELYLTDDYIIVIAGSSIYEDPVKEETEGINSKYYYRPYRNSTKMLIYSTKDYELVREIETEGSYVSSRKVDDDVYMITDKYIYYSSFNDDEIMPLYKDSLVDNSKAMEVEISSIRCFPSFVEDSECSYMIITSFSLDRLNEKANIETFLGTGEQIYCSKDNLYVTKTDYNYTAYRGGIIGIVNDVIGKTDDYDNEDKTETIIRRFAIFDGKIKYVSEGKVPGTLLNQFSMDEYDNYFRITTTKGDTWNETSENNLYVLDEKLNIVGKLEGLAKGERIYSTRFMGDKCYVVTYKTVDPLFVLDLSNPQKPAVLGELKIPGYSSYLHPLGDNYLIGFGEDSVEKTYKNYDGTEGVTAYSTGLKLAIFDVSDLNNPKELDSVKIGGRGSYSELLYNHKSLLFRESDGLFAFPVNLYEENAGYYEDGTPKYGKQEFNGFIVFNVSAENGISFKGKISSEKAEKYYSNSAQRIIYIGDKLYSIFTNMIKVNDMNSIEELDKITFNNKAEQMLYID